MLRSIKASFWISAILWTGTIGPSFAVEATCSSDETESAFITIARRTLIESPYGQLIDLTRTVLSLDNITTTDSGAAQTSCKADLVIRLALKQLALNKDKPDTVARVTDEVQIVDDGHLKVTTHGL